MGVLLKEYVGFDPTVTTKKEVNNMASKCGKGKKTGKKKK